jgi:hypothetical protein
MCSDDDLNAEMIAHDAARAEEYEGWYLRHGRYSHGPESDAAWADTPPGLACPEGRYTPHRD